MQAQVEAETEELASKVEQVKTGRLCAHACVACWLC